MPKEKASVQAPWHTGRRTYTFPWWGPAMTRTALRSSPPQPPLISSPNGRNDCHSRSSILSDQFASDADVRSGQAVKYTTTATTGPAKTAMT